VKIKIIENNKVKEINVKEGLTIVELAKILDLVLPCYIPKINDKTVPDDEKLKEGDKVVFFKVIGGGD